MVMLFCSALSVPLGSCADGVVYSIERRAHGGVRRGARHTSGYVVDVCGGERLITYCFDTIYLILAIAFRPCETLEPILLRLGWSHERASGPRSAVESLDRDTRRRALHRH